MYEAVAENDAVPINVVVDVIPVTLEYATEFANPAVNEYDDVVE